MDMVDDSELGLVYKVIIISTGGDHFHISLFGVCLGTKIVSINVWNCSNVWGSMISLQIFVCLSDCVLDFVKLIMNRKIPDFGDNICLLKSNV